MRNREMGPEVVAGAVPDRVNCDLLRAAHAKKPFCIVAFAQAEPSSDIRKSCDPGQGRLNRARAGCERNEHSNPGLDRMPLPHLKQRKLFLWPQGPATILTCIARRVGMLRRCQFSVLTTYTKSQKPALCVHRLQKSESEYHDS
jgi:hypothetical protein